MLFNKIKYDIRARLGVDKMMSSIDTFSQSVSHPSIVAYTTRASRKGKVFLFGFFCSVFSLAIYADGEISPSIIPSQNPGFGGSITGLYLQPNADHLEYAIYTTPLPLPAPNWYQQTVKPAYGAAFALGLHYNLADRVDQVKLDWLHFNDSTPARFAATEPNTSVGPPYYFGPSEQFLLNTTANSKVDFQVDNVNLVFNHLINLTDNIQIKPFAGISGADLTENITNNYSGRDPVFGAYTHSVNIDSNFKGFGPRLGLDTGYFFNSHFSINAGVASSVFLGSLASSTNFTSVTAFVSDTVETNRTPAHTTLSNQRNTLIVPEIDAKLELFYTSTFNSNSTFTVQVGYMFQDYIKAIYHVTPVSLVPAAWEAGTVAIISQVQSSGDLSMNGPYITLVLK